MRLYHSKLVVLLLATVFFALKTLAQQPAVKPVTKFKPPVVKTTWGRLSGTDAVCFAEEAKQLLLLPLKVTDAQNYSYTIVTYQLAYTRVGITEDEETGKTMPTKDQVGSSFTKTPLPDIWQKNLEAQLQKGEELYFYDIIVYDKQGRRFFAPELKITIK
jgi:hypothetical protein